MVRQEHTAADLLRVVGEGRDNHTPEEVAAAEAALAGRLGGTRAQAQRRLTYGGALGVALGLTLLVAGAGILGFRGVAFLREEAAVGGVAGKAQFCIAVAVMPWVGWRWRHRAWASSGAPTGPSRGPG
jgi:hypothetical protein